LRIIIAAISLLVLLQGISSAQEPDLTDGRARSEAFLRNDLQPLWEEMTPEMEGALVSPKELERFRTELETRYGIEEEVTDEETRREGSYVVYQRTSRWTRSKAPILMQWTTDSEGKIAGFFVREISFPAESRFLDYDTKASLRLPFDGEWFVFWGGRSYGQNYHVADRAQRFALDLVVRKNGSTRDGPAGNLTSYHCWNRPVLAPADGRVASLVSDLPDQEIGRSDLRNPAGNHVVLDLGNDEYAFLAHMQQDSIEVAAGDQVAAGQMIGRCGNSGNTTEPHLHFHMQTTPNLADGEGLPAFFEDYRADGNTVMRGQPLRGETVEQQ